MWRRLDEGNGGGPLFRVGGEVPKGNPSQAHGAAPRDEGEDLPHAPPPGPRGLPEAGQEYSGEPAAGPRLEGGGGPHLSGPPPQGAPAAVQQRGEGEGEGAGHNAAPALALVPADPRPPSLEAAPPERLDVDRRRAMFNCSVVMRLTKISSLQWCSVASL